MKMGRVLVVDDVEENLYLLCALLQGHGYEAVTAAHGAEALEKARQDPPALIISDILMPVMDGFSLCREWKKDERLRTIPFVFYTATYTHERDRDFALSLGAERFVLKPEEPDALMAMIREVIQQAEGARSVGATPAEAPPAQLPMEAPDMEAPDKEAGYLRQYNEVLIRKLERKMEQLERANLELERANLELERANRKLEQDMAERKQLEAQLLRAQRLETAGLIAGQVAHDFNNLLGPLAAYPDLLKMQLPDGSPGRRYCDVMLEAVEQMSAINEDMMAMARRGHLERQPIDLNRLVRQSIGQQLGNTAELDFQLQLADDIPPAEGSPAQLLRVIANLIGNSREAMLDRGVLTLRTERIDVDRADGRFCRVEAGKYVRLTVADTGCGIPVEIQSRIFDPFFSTKTRARRRGCGLGLSIVQAIVEDHHGYLDLESEVGRGSTFMLYLPVARDLATVQPRPLDLQGGHETILIVDDDQLQREAERDLLESAGYRVDAVASGEEAVAYLGPRRVDLMILDMSMPQGIDGAETYRRVLGIQPGQKAILVSGFAESEQVRQAQRLGAGGYLRKPVNRERLIRAVREELDR